MAEFEVKISNLKSAADREKNIASRLITECNNITECRKALNTSICSRYPDIKRSLDNLTSQLRTNSNKISSMASALSEIHGAYHAVEEEVSSKKIVYQKISEAVAKGALAGAAGAAAIAGLWENLAKTVGSAMNQRGTLVTKWVPVAFGAVVGSQVNTTMPNCSPAVIGAAVGGQKIATIPNWLPSVIGATLASTDLPKPAGTSSQSTAESTNATKNTAQTPQESTMSSNDASTAVVSQYLKPYENGSKNYHGNDYSNYQVVSGFDENYCMNQKNTEYKNIFGEDGCTATADCIAGSIKRGVLTEPQSSDWSSQGARWTYTKPIDGSKTWTVQQQLTEIYDQIVNKGNPVVVRVGGEHSVTAVGIRNGADVNNLTPNDILVVDPYLGQVKTANEIYGSGNRNLQMQDNSGWSLRIPK